MTTMPDLHERFRSLDRVAAPDLWAEVERRVDNLGTAPSMGPVTLGRPAWRGAGADDRPSALHLLFVAAALLVALLLIFAIGAGRPLPAPTVHNGDIVVSWKGNLYGVDPATGNRDTVLECALSVVACENLENQAAWSPDGMSLAFVKTRFGGTAEGPDDLQDAELGLWILDIKTGSVRHLTTCGPDLCHVGIGVAWSPDGGRIALGIGERIDLVDQRGDAATRTIEPGH